MVFECFWVLAVHLISRISESFSKDTTPHTLSYRPVDYPNGPVGRHISGVEVPSASVDVLCRAKGASRGEAMEMTMNGTSGSVRTNGVCDPWVVYSLTLLTAKSNESRRKC